MIWAADCGKGEIVSYFLSLFDLSSPLLKVASLLSLLSLSL
jgi:hypothetical protein